MQTRSTTFQLNTCIGFATRLSFPQMAPNFPKRSITVSLFADTARQYDSGRGDPMVKLGLLFMSQCASFNHSFPTNQYSTCMFIKVIIYHTCHALAFYLKLLPIFPHKFPWQDFLTQYLTDCCTVFFGYEYAKQCN